MNERWVNDNLFREMKKNSVVTQSSGNFPSPGAPKGWCSERIPHPSSTISSKRHISDAAALTPFYSGRTLPSKWEDAERWICSPVSGYSVTKTSSNSQFQRRPKSKSGPIVPPGMGQYSPAMQLLDGAAAKNFMAASPFSTGVLVPNGACVNYGVEQGYLVQSESHVARWSDLVSENSLPSSQDEKLDDILDAKNIVSHVPSRRDMATQMSTNSSCHSSPNSSDEPQGEHPAKLEIREVQVDKRATMISWSKKYGSRRVKKGVPDVEELYQNLTGPCASSWDLSEAATSISKLQREKAKITAWENLQKAKAEAAIRKLEMKLEKKRSHSMDKILKRLKVSQRKAEEMRSSILTAEEEEVPKTSHSIRFFHKHGWKSSFRTCFPGHST